MELSQGEFTVTRTLDGLVQFFCPPSFVTRPETAVMIARAILDRAGCEVVFAELGQTVIRPPGRNGNGNGTGIMR